MTLMVVVVAVVAVVVVVVMVVFLLLLLSLFLSLLLLLLLLLMLLLWWLLLPLRPSNHETWGAASCNECCNGCGGLGPRRGLCGWALVHQSTQKSRYNHQHIAKSAHACAAARQTAADGASRTLSLFDNAFRQRPQKPLYSETRIWREWHLRSGPAWPICGPRRGDRAQATVALSSSIRPYSRAPPPPQLLLCPLWGTLRCTPGPTGSAQGASRADTLQRAGTQGTG